jgi:hypothetical protein
MSRKLWRLLLLLTALSTQSCFLSCFTTTTTTCSGGGFFSPTPSLNVEPEAVQGIGQPVTVTLQWQPGYTCTGATASATVTGVTLEVTDPDNQAVAATATEPVKTSGPYGTEVWQTTVTFTPSKSGPFHVLGTFEPGLALVQKDAWVVRDRRAEPAPVSLAGMSCWHLERTALGSVVCQQQNGNATLYRGGTQVATWSYGTAHVAGNVIWVQGGSSGLTRNLDTGTGPPVQTAAVAASLGQEVFSVTENDALTWAGGRLKLYHFNGTATLDVDAEVQVSLSVEPRALALSREGGSLVVSDWKAWSRLDMPQGQSNPTPSWADNEPATYQAPDGLWIAVDETTFRFVPADKRQPIAILVAPTGWKPSTSALTAMQAGDAPVLFAVRSTTAADGYSTNTTIDKTVALVPTVKGTQVELAAFTAPAGATFAEVTQGHLRATRNLESYLWPLAP